MTCFLFIDGEGRIRGKRGPTRAKEVWNLQAGERIIVKCNSKQQPIKKGGGILGGWLGTVARKGNLCPLNYKSWKAVPSTLKAGLIKLTRVSFII